MSNRFHNKWHRHNHSTLPVAGEADSSHDPIASPSDPFLGSFCISGQLSSTSISTDHITTNTLTVDILSTANILVDTLTSTSRIFLASGSASAPSLTFSNKPNWGFFDKDSISIGLATNGNSNFVFSQNSDFTLNTSTNSIIFGTGDSTTPRLIRSSNNLLNFVNTNIASTSSISANGISTFGNIGVYAKGNTIGVYASSPSNYMGSISSNGITTIISAYPDFNKPTIYADGNAVFVNALSAGSIWTNVIVAASSISNVFSTTTNLLTSFLLSGNDVSLEPPVVAPNPYTQTVFVLSGAGIYGFNWGQFNGSVKVNNNLSANNIYSNNSLLPNVTSTNIVASYISANRELLNSLTATNSILGYISSNEILTNRLSSTYAFLNYISASQLLIGTLTADQMLIGTLTANQMVLNNLNVSSIHVNNNGCVFTNNISSNTAGYSGINIWNNINLNNYSVSGINNGGIRFQNGMAITSDNTARIRLSAYSVAEGNTTVASGLASHAEGQGTIASGINSHAEGNSTTASTNNNSHAEGNSTFATGENSHAEGLSTQATGINSHAEGSHTTASGSHSHAEGYYTVASGDMSHAAGRHATADQTRTWVWSSYPAPVRPTTTGQFMVSGINGAVLGNGVTLDGALILSNIASGGVIAGIGSAGSIKVLINGVQRKIPYY